MTEEEKAKIIVGCVGLATIFVAFFVWYQLAVLEDRFHIMNLTKSGISMLSAARLMVLSFYFVIAFPTLIVGVVASCYLSKRSAACALRNFIFGLAVTSVMFLLSALLLTIFDILFSNASAAIQGIFMTFAFLISMVATIRVLMSKKVLDYQKKLFQ